jgi:hypothetical protein
MVEMFFAVPAKNLTKSTVLATTNQSGSTKPK